MRFFVDAADLPRVEADIQTRTIPGFKRQVMEASNDAARAAWAHAKEHAPVQSGNLRAAIHLDEAVYRPGGAGGGGGWEASVGVDTTLAPQAVWLIEGTGLYGPEHRPIMPSANRASASSRFMTRRGNQYAPRMPRALRLGGGIGVLTFQKHGEPRRFRPDVAGQRAQPDWWFDALDVARQILTERLAVLDIDAGR